MDGIPVLIMVMMVAMMVILIVFAFILVMGGADSAPKDDGTVVIRVDKEHAQEVADIFKQLLCDKFEYDSSHERQRDQDIISDVFNTTPPPPGEAPGRELFRKLTDFKNLSSDERMSVIANLDYFGIPVDISKLTGEDGGDGDDDDDNMFVPEDEEPGVTHQSSIEDFDRKAGVSDGADGKPSQRQEEGDDGDGSADTEKETEKDVPKEEEEKKGKDVGTKGRKPRVTPVRTEESDKKKKDAKPSGRSGSHSAAAPKDETPAAYAPQAQSVLDEDRDFGAKPFDPLDP